jgi:uncharacterized protein YkwD
MKISKKMLMLGVAGLAAFLFVSPAPAQSLKPPKKYTRSGAPRIQHLKEVERRVFHLTNEARRKNGLPSLEPDETLTATARQHSDDMLKRDFFSHTDPDGKTVKDRLFNAPAVSKNIARAGENIHGESGRDWSDIKLTARHIVDSWMTSPGHRENILRPEYTHLGVGVAVMDKDLRATQVFVTRPSGR